MKNLIGTLYFQTARETCIYIEGYCLVTVMSDSFATSWTVAHQDPLSMEFPRQEHWSGLPFPSAEYLPDPGISESPAL